jgi:hypothetical protein
MMVKYFHAVKLYICDLTQDQCGDTVLYNQKGYQPECDGCSVAKERSKGKVKCCIYLGTVDG